MAEDSKHNRFPEPTEAKRFLERKLNVKTDAWNDLKWGEHSHAFTVAHSVEANVLDDIRGLINKAVANGETLETFRKGMLETMAKTGWYGKAGKTAEDKAYINWRIKIIYQTNMRTAYSAARYREQLEGAEDRPIWVYLSKVHGKNRRQEHIALHNKAFRHDDPFWNSYYPPNGWGCQCRVTTKSEHGAVRDGVTVLKSDADGNPPPISGMDWDAFDPTWQYNPALEALAPNFGKYKNLKEKDVAKQVEQRYRDDVANTRMTLTEFKWHIKRLEKDPKERRGINYQVGNLEGKPLEKMNNDGVADSKIMCIDTDLYHGIAHKNNDQKVEEKYFDELYELFQNPEAIYENTKPKSPLKGREFHFVKKMKGGKALKVVLRHLLEAALQIVTMGVVDDHYKGLLYKKIW